MEAMEVLRQVVAADKAARKRVESARLEKDSFDERLTALSRELEDSAMEHTRQEIDTARRESERTSARTLEALDRECAEAMERMRARFEEKKDEGVEAMLRAVIGLDD